MLLGLALGIVVTAFVLQVISAFVPSFEIEDWAAAFWGALILGAIEWGAMFVWQQVAPATPAVPWQFYALLYAINTLALAFASVLVGGLHVGGPTSLLASGALLTAANFGVQVAVSSYVSWTQLG